MSNTNKSLIAFLIIIVSSTIMYLISGYPKTNPAGCTMEAKICPDGSSVGRIGPNCEFAPCPAVKKKPTVAPSLIPTDAYLCPKSEWVDCMPGPDKPKPECDPQHLWWAKENCPGFKGAAY